MIGARVARASPVAMGRSCLTGSTNSEASLRGNSLGVEYRPLPHPRILEAIMPATFVLVHGAWLGGWCWKKVTPRLRAAGHEVFAPTLTGLGERSHLFSPEVGLDTHVEDIVAILDYEDLTD